jgi:DNA-binding winged helix-turn-helix (wHTH) protein
MLYLFENFTLDVERRELRSGTRSIAVEPQVFDLLVFLIRNRERVVPKGELLREIWQKSVHTDAAISTGIHAARSAIGDSGAEQRLIKTVHSIGFRFVGEVRVDEPGVPHVPVASSPTLSNAKNSLPPDDGARTQHHPVSPSNRLYKYSTIVSGMAVAVGVLGGVHEFGFFHSVRFEPTGLSWVDFVKSGITWISPFSVIISLATLWLLSRRHTIRVRWALITGAMLFGLLSWPAFEVFSRRDDLDVWAIASVGFLASLTIVFHARAQRLSRVAVLCAVAASALSVAWVDGVAEGSRAKRSMNLHDLLLRGATRPTIVSLLRTYKHGLLVVMPSPKLGGGFRGEVAFIPSWRVCKISAEWHLDPGPADCS